MSIVQACKGMQGEVVRGVARSVVVDTFTWYFKYCGMGGAE